MPESQPAENEIPTARIATVEHPAHFAGRIASRLWNVTALCFLIALFLVWAQLRSTGVPVQIFFADGNGIVPGDKVRYRGIDVGEVKSVVLDEQLKQVVVTADLTAESAALAREGTRFWIERPDIRFGQVRGLDTLVSGRYVGVLPGPANSASASVFEGLTDPPANLEELTDGLEILLESVQRYGLQRGSPVSYRGVEIGHVIGVGLTNDSATVVARTYIRPEYRSLIRDNTRFWSNSGIDLRFGFQGLEFDAETLATIAAGGVALATPDEPGDRVSAGHRFELTKSPRDEWLEWQPRLAIGSASLPDDFIFPRPTLAVLEEESSIPVFGGTKNRGWLIALDNGHLLGPADLLTYEGDKPQNLEIWSETIPLEPEGAVVKGGLASRAVPAEKLKTDFFWPVADIQTSAKLDGGLKEVLVTCGSDNLTLPVSIDRLELVDDVWKIDSRLPIDESWHGACVLSVADRKLIGFVRRTENGMVIETIDANLLESP